MVQIFSTKEDQEKAFFLFTTLLILYLFINTLNKSIIYCNEMYPSEKENFKKNINGKNTGRPSYCDDPEYIRNRKLIHSGSAGAEDGCREGFTNTVKDVYGFNDLHSTKLHEEASDYYLRLPNEERLKKNNVPLPADKTNLNQLLSNDKQFFQAQSNTKYDYVENDDFKQYWNEFGLKHPNDKKLTENFKVGVPISSKNKTNNKCTIEKMENHRVDTLDRYIKKIKEPINFDTYKPLFNHAGITDENILPPNFGSLHHQYLDRFKYAPPLADMEPQYDVPYEFKKETQASKDGYNDFLRESFIDKKIKDNHTKFVKQLKEKNISGNKAKEKMVLSGDSSICGTPLARDCFSNLGSCGSSSYNNRLYSSETYLNHKTFCTEYCKPVSHCVEYP